jgi:uncharacterized pyridoxal phosphate-containing UPF0001 family protein
MNLEKHIIVSVATSANSNKAAWEYIQKEMEGEAEKAGFYSEEDVVRFCREIRKEKSQYI